MRKRPVGAEVAWDETRLPNLVIRALSATGRRSVVTSPNCSGWCPVIDRSATSWRALAMRALFIVCVIDVLGFGILIPLIPYMATRFGATPALITPILGIYSLFQLLAAPMWGCAERSLRTAPDPDHEHARRAVPPIVLLAARALVPALFLARALAGVMAGNIVGGHGLCLRHQLACESCRSLGMVGAAIGIGFMLGPAIGGALAGEHCKRRTFCAPALVSAALSVVAMLLVLLCCRRAAAPEQRRAHSLAHRPPRLALLRTRRCCAG